MLCSEQMMLSRPHRMLTASHSMLRREHALLAGQHGTLGGLTSNAAANALIHAPSTFNVVAAFFYVRAATSHGGAALFTVHAASRSLRPQFF